VFGSSVTSEKPTIPEVASSLRKNSVCPPCIDFSIVAGSTVRRSTMVQTRHSFAGELSGVAICAVPRLN